MHWRDKPDIYGKEIDDTAYYFTELLKPLKLGRTGVKAKIECFRIFWAERTWHPKIKTALSHKSTSRRHTVD